jgi:hypothetical protein
MGIDASEGWRESEHVRMSFASMCIVQLSITAVGDYPQGPPKDQRG